MISKLSTKRWLRKMLLKSLPFLILSGCVSAPPRVDTKFDGKWSACEIVPQKTLMCLSEPDLLKLRALLVRCGAEQ